MRHLLARLVFVPFALLAFNANPVNAASPARAQAVVTATPGNTTFGILTLEESANGLRISGMIRGFSPSTRHGFHVLETGECKPEEARTAGVHFNPGKRQHGDPSKSNHHAGDLPNVDADAQGNAMIDITIKGVTLGTDATSLINRAIIFSQRSDDYTTQPSGGSGPRIACGVIKPV